MKKVGYLALCGAIAVSLSGCMTPQGRPDYTASGALGGAATGAVIGSMAAHDAGQGALIGGAIGAIVGGIAGHGMDQAQEAQLQAQSPETMQHIEKSDPLTLYDIKSMARAHIGDDLIISQIRNSRTVYHLRTSEIIDLRNAGVSERVIDFMINTPTEIQPSESVRVIGTAPPPPLVEPVVVAPGPGYFWVGGTWLWFGDHWGWRHGYWHRPGYRHGYWHH